MTGQSTLLYKNPNHKEDIFNELRYENKIDIDTLKSLNLGWCQFNFMPYKSHLDLNDASLVTELVINGTSLLLTGDIEEAVEKELLPLLRDVDILKVPHHGSKTSSTHDFVKKVNAELAVVCVGKNFYGHPSKSVLNTYELMGTEVLQTVNGCVKISIYPFGYYFVKPWK